MYLSVHTLWKTHEKIMKIKKTGSGGKMRAFLFWNGLPPFYFNSMTKYNIYFSLNYF